MDEQVRHYLATIGQRGGQTSKRELSVEVARRMVKVREARKAYRKYHARCFWSYDPDLKITIAEVPWVAAQLMKQGGRDAWQLGSKLCH